MGSTLAKCLPAPARTAIAGAIPDREVLLETVERLTAFEKAIEVKKKERVQEKQMKKAMKTVRALKSAVSARKALD